MLSLFSLCILSKIIEIQFLKTLIFKNKVMSVTDIVLQLTFFTARIDNF